MNSAMTNQSGKISIIVTVAVLLLCAPATEIRNIPIVKNDTKLYREISDADTVVIAWDPSPWNPDSVKYYELFYRPFNDSKLTLVKGNIPPSKNPEVVIRRTDISSTDSLLYFSIRYVTNGGLTSDYHLSSDSTAIPAGGWFLIWKH
jgi:hypothetical protein